MSDNRPIGIFDSGIGGMTVAHAISSLLPQESIVYFGDTAHLPYGDKSKESIQSYSKKIVEFLIERNCKIIVFACNTASSFAFESVQKMHAEHVKLINVIDPVVQHVCESNFKKVGIIGTKGTIGSRIYPRRIHAGNKEIKVNSRATPLLAPMIEEGFFNNYISKTIISAYLSNRNLQGIQAMVLGCTHYPLIKNEIIAFYCSKVKVIDSAQIVAVEVSNILENNNMFSGKGSSLEHHFFVSDYTSSFEKSTEFFFGKKIRLEKHNLWK